ncbi:tubulointerstitial nephritis antigen-like [Pollicipes pollicipes]|uniref:tubulointerstitial nephritis antigen-like n=1 Tax=Pollicipes pollicipes TaxID=41117 RepID=UPI00188499BE|nr:tubulointerstitial nephritis antigen-like [Pollicipes pollicipes]
MSAVGLVGCVAMQCCLERQDECSVPILGTLCYCDQFCDRSLSGDCCPDYFTFCLGEPNPYISNATCLHQGQDISYNETVKDNCNTCTCTGAASSPELRCETHVCLVEPELIERTNEAQLGWSAANYSHFWGRTLADGARLLLGTDHPGVLVNRTYPIVKVFNRASLPAEFDARQRPAWAGLIGPVVDQGWCGASWAVVTASAAADRISIQAGLGRIDLSAQNIIDCAPETGRGCRGGALDVAWNYLREKRVSSSACYPYRSGADGAPGLCLAPAGGGRLCQDGSRVSDQQLHGTQPTYRIASDEADIRHEIFTNGPVQAILRVQPDLFLYKSGVYSTSPEPTDEAAYHSVRILGWGEQRGPAGDTVPFWLVANSWGSSWGEQGLFRIRRGTNEADIETFVVAAWAQTDPPLQQKGGAAAAGSSRSAQEL